MKKTIVWPLLVALNTIALAYGPGSVVFADDKPSGFEHHGTSAKPIKRPPPNYPKSELRNKNQGWVRLSYVITTDGNVIDPVVEDSSGSRAFEKAALENALAWTFTPATWDGEVVEQSRSQAMVTFALKNSKVDVSKLFSNRYKKVIKYLDDGELDEAKELITKMSDGANLTVYEISRLWFLKSRYAGVKGNEKRQLSSLRRAAASNGRWIDARAYPALLNSILVLEIRDGQYSSALGTYDKFMRQDAEIKLSPQVSNAMQEILGIVASEQAIVVPVELDADDACDDCVADWQYKPLRSQFTISDIKGELSKLEIRCSWQRVVDTPQEGVTWKIPDEWGSCRVIVFGDAGASFSLLELPDEKSGTS